MKLLNKVRNIQDFMEKIWVEKYILISLIFGFVTGILYYFKVVINIRGTLPNVIIFAGIIVTVLSIMLTMLTLLKESPLFERIRKYFPDIEKDNYLWLRRELWTSLILVLISIIVSALPIGLSMLFTIPIAIIGSSIFWLMTIGSFYTIKIIIDLGIKDYNYPKKNKME